MKTKDGKDLIEELGKEKRKFMEKNPWVLLNSSIPMEWFTENSVKSVIKIIKEEIANGKDLSHIVLKNMITKEEINF